MTDVRKRVLIVEDQRLIAADLEKTLKKLGYEVVGSVGSGEEAVPKAFELLPDIVLLDIRLRGDMDGIQVAEAIRARLDTPVVYLTAYADEATIARAKATTPFGFVVKPFNERELRAAIEIALFKHETDRLLADERARRLVAEEFKLLVDCVNDYAIYRLDVTGRVASWNAGAERIEGYRAGEIIGKKINVFYTPEDVAAGKPDAELEQVKREGRAEYEGFRLRKGGSRFWANVVLTAIRDADGKLHGFGKVTRDLSERKRAEDEQKFLAESTAAMVASLDLERTLATIGSVAVPALGDSCMVTLLEPEGAARWLFFHADAEKSARGNELLRHCVVPHELPLGPELALRTGSSQLLTELTAGQLADVVAQQPELRELVALVDPVSLVSIPMKAGEGKVIGGVSFAASRGSERRYRPRDVGFMEEFTRRATMAIENARLFHQAQAGIRVRDEFLQVASHELKTPLTPLQLQLDALANALQETGGLNERIIHRIETATRQTARLSRLVDSLLDVSRLTADRLELELERFDLADALREVTDRFRAEARQVGSELTLRTAPHLPGRWDRLRVEQIVSNLLSNAIKYGEGKPIEVDVRDGDGAVRIAVTDRGIGIEEESIRRIFGRFERAVSSRNYGGLGLGLFIARELADAHGGTLVVESRPRAGSTFTVMLPFDAGRERAATPAGAEGRS